MTDNPDELFDDEILDDDDEDGIEAYCMTCKEKTVMEDPEPIWTRRGAPGMRGTCSICGTVVFRMGKTVAHELMRRPDPVLVNETPRGKGGRRKIAADVTYINYAVTEAPFAAKLAEDLNRVGIQTWLAENKPNEVHWATGVHPALVECKRMILVLTPLSVKATNVIEAWQFFVSGRKPIFVVQLEATPVPDELRTKPRVDFSGDDYKRALRQLVQAING